MSTWRFKRRTSTSKLEVLKKNRSQNGKERGKMMEGERVPIILQKLKDEGKIVNFKMHPDAPGIDVTITALVDGKKEEHSCGFTISFRKWNDDKVRWPDIPQFCFLWNMSDDNIAKKFLGLFKKGK
ncbi:MAG: hypothetical protein WCW87_04290 [Candidatus Paceibacterota bacterium]